MTHADDANNTADSDPADSPEPTPPDAHRVARRAMALMAVTARAVIERDFRNHVDSIDESHRKLQMVHDWFSTLFLDNELEPHEREFLHTRPAEVSEQNAINGLWRIEGLAVLAWALRRLDFPRYDQVANIDELWDALGILDTEKVNANISDAQLRSEQEIVHYRQHLFTIHWRIRQFMMIKREAMDLVSFAKTAWFGPLDLSGIDIVDRDLAVLGEPLIALPEDALSNVNSIAMERHKAINWLSWGPELYSQVETNT